MSIRTWMPLIALTIAVFGFNMSEFMPSGILQEIQAGVGKSESDIALVVSVYAWAVALLSLPLMVVLQTADSKKLLLGSVILYAVFQIVSGMSDSYGMLMISRICAAAGHAVFWSIAITVQVRIVDEQHKRFAISMVAVGTSVALIIGVPVGRILGLSLGWQAPFFTVQIILVIAGVMIAASFPSLPGSGKFSLSVVPEVLRSRTVLTIYTILVLFVTGAYTMYSFVEPYLAYAGLDETMVTVTLGIYGIAAMAAGVMLSRSRRPRSFFLTLAMVGTPLTFLLIAGLSGFHWAVIFPVAAWGIFLTVFNVISQGDMLVSVDEEHHSIAMSMYSALYNVGISMGAVMGQCIYGYSAQMIPLTSQLLTFFAMIVTVSVLIPRTREKTGIQNGSRGHN